MKHHPSELLMASLPVWLGFFVSHIHDVNEFMQFFCLGLGAVTTIISGLVYLHKWRHRNDDED